VDKVEFLSLVDSERAAWERTLAGLDESQLLIPIANSDWTIKDHIAHIAWSEREMIGILESRSLRRGSELWNRSQDERNAIVYQENHERPMPEVVAESKAIYSHLREFLGQLTDEDLNDPKKFELPPTWIPWQLFEGSTFGHYREHRQIIEEWLQQKTP